MSSLIKERSIGIDYLMGVYHISAVMPHERRESATYIRDYGMSFRVEHSHKSGRVHIQIMGVGQCQEFADWLKAKPDVLNGNVEYVGWFRKRRVTNYAFQRIEQAYARWIAADCPEPPK